MSSRKELERRLKEVEWWIDGLKDYIRRLEEVREWEKSQGYPESVVRSTEDEIRAKRRSLRAFEREAEELRRRLEVPS